METKITHQQKMWTAMRIMKSFSILELQAIAGVSEGTILKEWTVKHYCKILVRAGYLLLVNNNYFKLVKFSGPCAPMLTRDKKFVDPNTEEVIEIYKDKKPKHKQEVLKAINKGEEFTIQDIYDRTGLDKLIIRTVIKRLVAEGTIKYIGKRKVEDNFVNVYILNL